MRFKLRKNNSGFMLMEVLLTIAIIGMTLVPLFMMQTNALRGVYRYAQRLRLIFPAKNFMVDVFAGKTKQPEEKEKADSGTQKEKLKIPPAQLTHKWRKPKENSSLKKLKNMQVHEVIVRGTRGGRESIIGCVYKPERKKKQ